jgi:hypothetical protein
MRAACFTVLACGHVPRCALDLNDGGVVRFTEIVRMVASCEFSIHDISRVELDARSGLPRFNMPLELGADLGLRLEGPARQRRRRILILDAEPHRYDVTLSDISGMDIVAHANQVALVIRHVRDWLNANRSLNAPPLPGPAAIHQDYQDYQIVAPEIAQALRLDPHDEVTHGDFLYLVRMGLPRIAVARSGRRDDRHS